MHDPTLHERERDRELRAQLDPLVGQLSFTGKWELITRLMFDSLRQGFGSDAIEGHARTALPRRTEGSADLSERDGGGEEARRPNPPPS